MAHTDHYVRLFDQKGNLYAVMLSAEFWKKKGARIDPLLRAMLEEMEPTIRPEPLHEWEEFISYWDFKYPYSAEVRCGNCGAETSDWINDADKPFRLRSAQLGGLVVFTCTQCAATVRKKHFKDHVCYEYSVDSCGC